MYHSKEGLSSVKILIANPRRPEKTKEVELIVDTGAVYSMIPSKILRELGVEPEGTRTFTLASGEKIQRKVGGAIYKLDGIQGHAGVIFGEKGDQPLLGVTALEEMGLEVDPVTRKLKSTKLPLLQAKQSQIAKHTPSKPNRLPCEHLT